jgi:hypothetical protein
VLSHAVPTRSFDGNLALCCPCLQGCRARRLAFVSQAAASNAASDMVFLLARALRQFLARFISSKQIIAPGCSSKLGGLSGLNDKSERNHQCKAHGCAFGCTGPLVGVVHTTSTSGESCYGRTPRIEEVKFGNVFSRAQPPCNPCKQPLRPLTLVLALQRSEFSCSHASCAVVRQD